MLLKRRNDVLFDYCLAASEAKRRLFDLILTQRYPKSFVFRRTVAMIQQAKHGRN